jgi:hypothetical protein
MEENTTVDNDYKEAFNQGYELSKELGLKPNILDGLSSGKYRMKAMQDGMKQYHSELTEKNKDKEVIPPLDLDNLDNLSTFSAKQPSKSKKIDKDRDMEPDL